MTTQRIMHFRISSALKRVLGRDLITDEFVAIFELVKNSFDAQAKAVKIIFLDDSIYIVDDGKGMSLKDIESKWLFVAYSAKKDGTEDLEEYRGKISERRMYAGSKGVGRFSCDRLGSKLQLQTRQKNGQGVEVIEIDWNLFEGNAKDDFNVIPVSYHKNSKFTLPKNNGLSGSGTALRISGLREEWDREKLLRLRSALAKIINPFGTSADGFSVELWVDREVANDSAAADNASNEDSDYVHTVNGPIQNFIFDTLRGKTTSIDLKLSDDGTTLSTTLIDRGELIYEIAEKNTFHLLKNSGLNCSIFYLNRSAKQTFARRMGVTSTSFGSVFIFKNGFRIFPIGERGTDTFGIDRRKAQGYNRFLGSRDLIGRIDISGTDDDFQESTSRDQGLIDSPAYRELLDCFDEKCFRRLERYVVGVSWKDPHDLDQEDSSRLKVDSASARIGSIIAQLAGVDGVELVNYSRNLVRILNERSDDFSSSVDSLRILAEKSGDAALLRDIDAASERFQNLKRAEQLARETADRERIARRAAERAAIDARQYADALGEELKEEKKRSLFLTSLTSLDKETIEILHHQIVIHAAAINEIVGLQFDLLRDGILPTREAIVSLLENISFQNKKILSTARFATKANFRLDSEQIDEDIASYITDYLINIAPYFSDSGISITVKPTTASLKRLFKPIEISILLDNLVSNAGKANSSDIEFSLNQNGPNEIEINVLDNGDGIDGKIHDLSRMFEKGFTTSTGSGLGLYHINQILDDMGGSITANREPLGAKFTIRIRDR